jgi:hypothetical protein
MRPPVLRIGNLRPRFQIARERHGHARAVRPFDLDFLALGKNVVEIIVRRHHKPALPSSSWIYRQRLRGVNERGFWFLVSGFWFLVSGFWFLVSGFWFLVSGFPN